MDSQTVVFIGRSGCGKGTQSTLLMKYLEEKDPAHSVYHLQIGQEFREFITENGYAQEISKEVYKEGGLQPIFLTVWLWGSALIKNFKIEQHLIVDGTPRRPAEVPILHDAMTFFKRGPRHIIHMDVSREWSKARLKARGRGDDIRDEDIEKRLNWFESDVAPTIEALKVLPGYEYHKVNGEQSIDAVHREVLKAIFPDGAH